MQKFDIENRVVCQICYFPEYLFSVLPPHPVIANARLKLLHKVQSRATARMERIEPMVYLGSFQETLTWQIHCVYRWRRAFVYLLNTLFTHTHTHTSPNGWYTYIRLDKDSYRPDDCSRLWRLSTNVLCSFGLIYLRRYAESIIIYIYIYSSECGAKLITNTKCSLVCACVGVCYILYSWLAYLLVLVEATA